MQVAPAIDACSAANTEASLKASIAQGMTNKDLSDKAIAVTLSIEETSLLIFKNFSRLLQWQPAKQAQQ